MTKDWLEQHQRWLEWLEKTQPKAEIPAQIRDPRGVPFDLHLPAEIIDLIDFCTSQGLTCVRLLGPDPIAFGDLVLAYAGSGICVEIMKDRSIWLLSIGEVSQAGHVWPDVPLMMTLLTRSTCDLVPLREEISFVKSHWAEIVDYFSADQRAATRARLDVLTRERAKRLFC